MRTSALMIGLVSIVFATTGMSECDPGGGGGGGGGGGTDNAKCDGHCKVEVHLDSKCAPVDDGGKSSLKTNVNPNSWVCFINDAGCTVRLTFPGGLFVDDKNNGVEEVTLKDGECARLRVDRQAARKKFMYTIACDCTGVPGGGSGNPEFNVGGGGGGGGGG